MDRMLIALALLLSSTAHAGEAEFRDAWCSANNGRAEVTLPDRTRADCITDTHAVEVDHGRKWAEAIGQSLYYALQTNKRAGILLILHQPRERRFWYRLNSIIRANDLPIDVWVVESWK